MSKNFKKDDLRIIKTRKGLISAMLTLLNQRNFAQITVNDLCAEALISRATFYTHFNDKYDLLKYWLTDIRKEIIKDVNKYDEMEAAINLFVEDNKKIIMRILKNANNEILELVNDFMSFVVDLSVKRRVDHTINPSHIILFNFCIGGLTNLLLWQVKNEFPLDIKMMNKYLYDLLKSITEWDAQQELKETSLK